MAVAFRFRAEYAALRGAEGLLRAPPEPLALGLAAALAAAAFAAQPRTRRRVDRRLEQVFGATYDPAARRRLARRAWRHFIFSMVDALRAPAMDEAWLRRHTNCDALSLVRDLKRRSGGGIILAVPHMGSWELAGVAVQRLGIDLLTIVRRQRNPLLDRHLHRVRQSTGVTALYYGSKLITQVAGQIRAGRTLAILPDLRAKTHCIPVQFLGQPAQIPPGMAQFARAAQAPILPAAIVREGWTQHRWLAFDPIEPDLSAPSAEDAQRLTQGVMDCFTQAIRRQPEQYFWFNRRWVLGAD
ncbi:MAG: lysophospholipid acyltransferase family protein [Candidatus Marinimicrobia bacterium]|nr:lysophospholipid acyltransferase family protein [Candidatus Neomarinimicrobiota bacterium]